MKKDIEKLTFILEYDNKKVDFKSGRDRRKFVRERGIRQGLAYTIDSKGKILNHTIANFNHKVSSLDSCIPQV